jgi:hypothetical protein
MTPTWPTRPIVEEPVQTLPIQTLPDLTPIPFTPLELGTVGVCGGCEWTPSPAHGVPAVEAQPWRPNFRNL